MNVKLLDIDDELLYKKMKIKYGDFEVTTPTKAGYSGKPIGFFNEILKNYDSKKLDRCLENEIFERRANTEVERLKFKKAMNFFFMRYADKKLPTSDQMELLSDIQYVNSEIVVTPLWSEIINDQKNANPDLINVINKLNNEYIEFIKTMNNKEIIGVINSKLPRQMLEPLIENYLNNDVTSFILDNDGKGIDSNKSWIRRLLRLFKQYDLVESSFLYSINSYAGRFSKDMNETLAKDYMGHAYGVDIVGLNHKSPNLSSEQWSKFEAMGRDKPHKVFDRDSYGYLKLKESELFELTGAPETENPFEVRKNYNITQQYLEDEYVKQKLSEESTLEKYVSSKATVEDKMIKDIKKLKQAVSKD